MMLQINGAPYLHFQLQTAIPQFSSIPEIGRSCVFGDRLNDASDSKVARFSNVMENVMVSSGAARSGLR